MKIRFEQDNDKQQIQQLHIAIFETDAEARLVNSLRDSGCEFLSLVAVKNNKIIGHILFTPVTLDQGSQIKLAGLAPLAVASGLQGTGIGTALINAGLQQCERQGFRAVVALGAPDYYGRFGFQPASDFAISTTYDVEDKFFMLRELQPGAIAGNTGIVRYHEAFAEL